MNRERLLKGIVVTALISIIAFSMFGVYRYGTQIGFNNAITSLAQALQKAGANVDIVDLDDGTYQIVVHFPSEEGGVGKFTTELELHMWVEHFDKFGNLVSRTFHAMTLTNTGKDFIEGKLGDNSFANTTGFADYIGMSNDSSAFSATWTTLPSEITTAGLTRAQGTYVSTGTGTWNCSKAFSVTATEATKLYGLYWNSGTTCSLVAAEQQGVGSQKNVVDGDTLTITVQGTIT